MNTETEAASPDLWTRTLEFLQQIVAPSWNDLVPLLPLAIVGLVGLALLRLALSWRRASALNRSRVPARVPGTPPADVHLPGPSRWPLVVPIGAMLLLFGLALAPRDEAGNVTTPVNVPLFVAGLAITGIAVLGWLYDAMREWRRTASPPTLATGHAGALAAPQAGVLAPGTVVTTGAEVAVVRAEPAEPPPGVHLPGPSPWPLFAPVAMMVLLAGLVFGPILIVAGLVMGAIAAIGWLRDAGHEYRQTNAGHAPEPKTRDPAEAFPRRLVPIFAGVGAVAIALTLSPFLLTLLPGAGAAGGGSPAPSGGAPAGPPYVSASTATEFEQTTITAPAGEPFELLFENKQAGVPHNVAIYDSPERATEIFNGELITGPAEITYEVPAIEPGEYFFVCIVHPPMTGTVVAQGE